MNSAFETVLASVSAEEGFFGLDDDDEAGAVYDAETAVVCAVYDVLDASGTGCVAYV